MIYVIDSIVKNVEHVPELGRAYLTFVGLIAEQKRQEMKN